MANSIDVCTLSCLTLTEFVANIGNLFDSNITVVFSPGIHYLNGTLNVSNAGTFLMTSEYMTAQIRCASRSKMVFNCSQNILITNLEFIGYEEIQLLRVERFVAHNTMFNVPMFTLAACVLLRTVRHKMVEQFSLLRVNST